MQRESILITAGELLRELAGPHPPVVADCRFALADPAAGERAYAAAHIPGAHYLHLDRDLAAPRGVQGGRHPVPEPDTFGARMRAIGLSPGQILVAYDDSRAAFASRLWWLLRYFGHAEVRILDGGWGAWCRAGGVQTNLPPDAVRPGSFEPRPDPRLCVDYEELLRAREAGAGPMLVDAREPRRYAGIEEPIDPVAGHIPGAVNRPWPDATDAQGSFLDSGRQAARWAAFAPDRALVMYCGSGVTACVNLVSLALAGREARLYPGSWSDWCSRPAAPVATGESPG